MALALINKTDNFELITEAIGRILRDEFTRQHGLAVADPDIADATPWLADVYVERSNPWDIHGDSPARRTPIINVTFERADFVEGESNNYEKQTAKGVFNVDAYGFGEAEEIDANSHSPGDRLAALEAKRAIRLVRNILMAAENVYLGMRGIVQTRWMREIVMLRPDGKDLPAINVIGARLPLVVDYSETAPQIAGLEIDTLLVEVEHGTRGESVQAQFNVAGE